MAPELMPEPWYSFLSEVDRAATARIAMHCIGGFAVSLYYGLARRTGDIDAVEVAPSDAKPWLARIAGQGSALHKKHKVYLQIVTVAVLPYPTRTESTRSSRINWRNCAFEDVKHLVRSKNLDLTILEARYKDEVRPLRHRSR